MERPTVAVLEDVQAADPATRDLIAFLLHNFRDERLLLILTFRTEHLPRGHALLGWIAELGRHPRTTMLALEPLSPEETSIQVEAILGTAADAQLAARIYRRSGGNPLFTEELIATAASGSATLPDVLSEMLLAKVRALPDPSSEVLRAAAVVGRPFDEGLLAAVLGGAEGDYLAPVRQAVDGQVLVADEDGYRFRHGLFSEAIVEDLTWGERRDLHARIAAALEARPVPADGVRWEAGEAAKHWQSADRPIEAYRSSIEAALAVTTLRASASALEHWETALKLQDRVEAVTRTEILAAHGLDEVDLLVRAAWAADLVGKHDRAIELADGALALVDPSSDPARAGTLRAESASSCGSRVGLRRPKTRSRRPWRSSGPSRRTRSSAGLVRVRGDAVLARSLWARDRALPRGRGGRPCQWPTCVRGRRTREPGRRPALHWVHERGHRTADRSAPDGSGRWEHRAAPVRDGQPRGVPDRRGPARGGPCGGEPGCR